MIDNFIPELWAANLLLQARKNLVYGQPGVINRNYQGTIGQKGDTLHIVGIGSVTISDYTKGTDMAAPQQLTDADTELRISQQKSFSVAIEDLDKAQAAGNFEAAARDQAGYDLADTRDQFIASLYTDASAANLNGSDASAIVPDAVQDGGSNNIFNVIEDCATLLSDSKVPKIGRFMVVPPWVSAMITKDLKLAGAAAGAIAGGAILNGFVTRIAGFDVLESQNVPNTGGAKYKILFGTSQAITFADQIVKVEALRDPDQFRDIVRGLDVYGAKVAQPDYLGVMTMSKT
ncbi:MAG: P22 coat protein - gene protein 5 [Methanosaeta sp. PtaB.Bin039]|nr:MAG: P22 coat protein - gene protein 5 [Methanosaeta sp. PtaB.Bin039]